MWLVTHVHLIETATTRGIPLLDEDPGPDLLHIGEIVLEKSPIAEDQDHLLVQEALQEDSPQEEMMTGERDQGHPEETTGMLCFSVFSFIAHR